ncbi:MAG: DUF721 domain-containing protein [Actinobacteria bacterium]|nr:DUF721 domain-containing protein [Actinomycetota bacterium]
MTRRQRGAGEPESLGDLVGELTSARGWASRLRDARVHRRWPQIVGPELAAHVEPVRLHGGVLVVRAESPPWATQVRYLSGQLAERANEILGAGSVRRVNVVVASGGRTGPPTRK